MSGEPVTIKGVDDIGNPETLQVYLHGYVDALDHPIMIEECAGFLHCLTAGQARVLAGALLALADQVDNR